MNPSATVKGRLLPGPGDVVSRLAAEARRAAAQHLHPLLEAIRQDARLFVLYRRSDLPEDFPGHGIGSITVIADRVGGARKGPTSFSRDQLARALAPAGLVIVETALASGKVGRAAAAAARRGQHVVVIETLAPQRDAWCEFVAERAPAATITLAEWSRVVCIRVIRTKKAA